jgi:hypothetical protein
VSNSYVLTVRQSFRLWLAGMVLVALSPLVVAATQGSAAASTHSSCHAPRMIGLTVAAARARAKTSGCQLRLTGASVKMAKIQTIRKQSARPGQRTRLLTITVNPLCPGSGAEGPPPGEPLMTPGPTELDTGLFIEGGPFIYRSAPVCKDLEGTSSAGKITVTNNAGTAIANNVSVSAGQLLKITLSAGQYTITGVFADGTKVGPTTVTVPAGEVVRQDVVLSVP